MPWCLCKDIEGGVDCKNVSESILVSDTLGVDEHHFENMKIHRGRERM